MKLSIDLPPLLEQDQLHAKLAQLDWEKLDKSLEKLRGLEKIVLNIQVGSHLSPVEVDSGDVVKSGAEFADAIESFFSLRESGLEMFRRGLVEIVTV